MRRSGAPPWAISLGLGTWSESSARSTPTKMMSWAFWSGVLACVVLGYGAAFYDLPMTSGSFGRSLLISTVIVLGTVALTTMLCRAKQIR